MFTYSIPLQASVYPAHPLFLFVLISCSLGWPAACYMFACVAKDDLELLILMSAGVTGMWYYSQFMSRLS